MKYARWMKARTIQAVAIAVAIFAIFSISWVYQKSAPSASRGVAMAPSQGVPRPIPGSPPKATPDSEGEVQELCCSDDAMVADDAMMSASDAAVDMPMPSPAPSSAAAPKQTRNMTIVYNKPKYLPFDKSSKLMATVASSDLQEAVQRVKKGVGAVAVGRGALSYRVRAELVGAPDEVEITATGTDSRVIDPAGNTTWTWYVKPKTTSDFELTLLFYNVVGGETGDVDGPVFTSTFIVQATLWQLIKFYAEGFNPVYTALAGIVAAIAGGKAWLDRRKSRAASSASVPPVRKPRSSHYKRKTK